MSESQSHKEKLIGFYRRYNRMPGYQEIMALVGFKSKNAVYKLINRLVEDGVLNKDAKGRITFKNFSNNIFSEVPLLGLVEAGIPSVAEEMTLDTINLDEYLIDSKENTYVLEVKGDSMIDAGIKEKDLVVAVVANSAGGGSSGSGACSGKNEPKDGDIVIAEVDGGWTMKYLRKKSGRAAYLEPANKKYKPIYPAEEMRIAAIVKGVIRKY